MSDDVDGNEIEEALEILADAVDGATDDALDAVEADRGIMGREELYQAHGFSGETMTIEVELYGAELYTLLDLLDRTTDQQLPAEQFIPAATALRNLIRASPTGTWSEWLAASMTDDTTDTEQGADE